MNKFYKTGFHRKFCCALLDPTGKSNTLPPPTQLRITRVRDFVADLARAGKSFTEIKKNRGSCLRGPELEFFATICQGARHWARHLILKETVRTAIFIASVAAAVADERGLTPGLFLLRMEKLRGALQKVRPPRRQVRRKILRNKHPPSSNRCHFIYTFAFVCIHTSYKFY
jgi:hypothetical protein